MRTYVGGNLRQSSLLVHSGCDEMVASLWRPNGEASGFTTETKWKLFRKPYSTPSKIYFKCRWSMAETWLVGIRTLPHWSDIPLADVGWNKCHKSNRYLSNTLLSSTQLPFEQRTCFIKCEGRSSFSVSFVIIKRFRYSTKKIFHQSRPGWLGHHVRS